MTSARSATPGIALWWLICLALGAPAWAMKWVPLAQATSTWPALAQCWALHPDAALQQPAWVWWTTAWLHGSEQHLTRNLLALALIALLGAASHVTPRSAIVWALAWPATHLGMLAQPGSLHTYIGMSGVLHAGVAIVAIQQIELAHNRERQFMGWGLLIALGIKILMENPWSHILIQPTGSDITVAPWSHLSGSVLGVILYLCSSVTKQLIRTTRQTPRTRTLI